MYVSCKQHAIMLFKDKVVIVVGATSKIGESTCLKFAKKGASVVLVGKNDSTLHELKQKLDTEGFLSHIIKADITEEDQAKRVIEETMEKFNKIDVLVNNVNIFRTGNMIDKSILSTYDEIMNTNIHSVIHMTNFATPHLIATKGNIVNVSSIGGERVLAPHFSIFCVSHAAINHFTKASAIELGKSGVRVNAVSPGVNASGEEDHETLISEWADTSEIADLILLLAGEESKSITGSNYVCDSGGLACQKTVLHV